MNTFTLTEVPRIGKLHGDFFQSLEKQGTQVSNAWNG